RSSFTWSATPTARCWRCRCAGSTNNHKGSPQMIAPRLRAQVLPLTLLLVLTACSRPAAVAPPAVQPPRDPWPQFAARFLEEYCKADPRCAVEGGRHEFDGQMPDWSAAGLAAKGALLKRLRAEAAAFDASRLTAAERFEREHLYTAIDTDLFWLEDARAP